MQLRSPLLLKRVICTKFIFVFVFFLVEIDGKSNSPGWFFLVFQIKVAFVCKRYGQFKVRPYLDLRAFYKWLFAKELGMPPLSRATHAHNIVNHIKLKSCRKVLFLSFLKRSTVLLRRLTFRHQHKDARSIKCEQKMKKKKIYARQ